MVKIRILVADDQLLFARMLKTVLETRTDSFEVVGLAADGREAVDLVASLGPDILLLDLRMPELDGIGTIEALNSRGLAVKIIMLTTFDDDEAIHRAIGAGVAGYILKDCAPEELFSAIRAVHLGASTFSPGVVRRLAGRRDDQAGAAAGIREKLNRREMEILALVAEGLENKEIADRLFIAEQTVKNNVSSIYEKLEVRDRAKLVKIAEAYLRARG
jgi:DNA-binding NarL/FixJ family response regulator